MWTKLLQQWYKDQMARCYEPDIPYSQSTSHKILRGSANPPPPPDLHAALKRHVSQDPYNIQSFQELRMNLIYPKGPAAKDLTASVTSPTVMDESSPLSHWDTPGENLVLLRETPSIPLRMEQLSFLQIWPNWLFQTCLVVVPLCLCLYQCLKPANKSHEGGYQLKQ